MMKRISFVTVGGQLDIVRQNEFIQQTAIQILQDQYAVNYHLPPSFKAQAFNSSFDLPKTEEIVRKELILKEAAVLSQHEVTRNPNWSITEAARTGTEKFFNEQLKVAVSKKNIEFFQKDLDFEAINKLADKYVERMGGNMSGVLFNLSQFQKFFMVANPESFMRYLAFMTDYSRYGDLIVKAALADFRPDQWVIGRYENPQFIREANEQRRYSP